MDFCADTPLRSQTSAGKVSSVVGNPPVGGLVGRASNRKRARRRAGHRSQQVGQTSRADAATQQAMLQLAAGLKALSQEMTTRKENETAARRAWCGGQEPVPAEAPRWPAGSLGDRLITGTFRGEALSAPSLLTADIPDAIVIAADPAQWNVAASALVRAAVFDGLKLDHPTVSMLLEVLAPIAEAELANREAIEAWLHRGEREWEEGEPEFPELDGPVFLLGTCALVDATWAVVGEDPLSEVLAVLLPALDGAVSGLESRVVADALIGAFASHYRCELPGDADVLECIKRPCGGDALETLVATEVVAPRDVLRVGLTVLSALAGLCRNGSASLLRRAA